MSALSRRAARVAAVLLCAGVLAGCAAPASESGSAAATPEPTAEPAASTALDPNRRSPVDPEYLTQLSLAATRAANYWQAELDDSAFRYLTANVGMSGVVDPNDDTDAAEYLNFLDTNANTTYREQVDNGEAYLVKVSFYVVYAPEANYLGPQYSDGTNSIYVLVPADDAKPCEVLSGWRGDATSSAIPETSDEAAALKLNEWQHTMLVHQCRALAAAGITDFTAPADWTDEQTAYYLAARGQDYGMTDTSWLGGDEQFPNMLLTQFANMLLTIDFTTEDDWSSNARFFALGWPGFGDTAPALPDTPAYTWAYARDGETLTATGSVDGTPAVQYTFAIYPGTDLKWDARTVCTGGRSLTA